MATNGKRGLLADGTGTDEDHHHHDYARWQRRKTDKTGAVAEEEDLFSKLPDEIIVSVLSCLERIGDRAVTSAVARRWRYLWKHAANTILEFDSVEPFDTISNRVKEFIRRVDQVVNSLSSCDDGDTVIDGFNLTLNMIEDKDGDNIKYHCDIDRWLRFALHKKVKRVKLDFGRTFSSNVYSLVHHPPPLDLMGSLRSLVLYGVEVSGELLEYILTTAAPLLEQLSVWSCGSSLVNLIVSGPSLKLKHLQVSNCRLLQRLDINDVKNLESLEYWGNAKALTVKDAPRLVKATTYVYFSDDPYDIPQLLRSFSHVEKLVMTLSRYEKTLGLSEFPKLINLQQLELVLAPHNVSCCRLSALLLDASSILRQLKIEFHVVVEYAYPIKEEEEEMEALRHPHKSLKVLELLSPMVISPAVALLQEF